MLLCALSIRPALLSPPARLFAKQIHLLDSELVFKYVKGSGPGGQAVNKTSNCVQLTHLPTGLQVYSHESRVAETNRHYALKKMKAKLDQHYNGDQSKQSIKQARLSKNKAKKQSKSQKKHEAIRQDKLAWQAQTQQESQEK